MDSSQCIRCSKSPDECTCTKEMVMVEQSYLEWAGKKLTRLTDERDALVRAIFFEHCLEGRNVCLKASVGKHCAICSVLKDIKATRKEMGDESD